MIFLDTFLKGLKPRFDDDAVDRLNYYYTPMILTIMSLTMSAKQYVGEPIQCWVPAQFSGAWEQYSENYCFVQNTYFVALHDVIPNSYTERQGREIGYYQWVPFILALQAILFYLPCLVWRLLNWQSGITVKGVVNMAQEVQNKMDKETRDKNVGVVSAHIYDCLDCQREMKGSNPVIGFLLYGKHYGSYVSGLYIFVKFTYLAQVFAQFYILNAFIGSSYTFWGFEILRDIANGREWMESGHFPRVTMCDFDVRVLGNLHRWTVQCVLMINMFNEKIFLFLWWWFLIVGICTFVSLAMWIVSSVGKSSQRTFVHRYLRISDAVSNSERDQRALSKFVHRCLRPDGVFLLRMVSKNAGDLVTTDIVHELWLKFLQRELQQSVAPPEMVTGKKSPSGLGDDEKTPLNTDM